MADSVDHTHGDNGEKPAQDLNFQSKEFPDPEVFDWFWSEVPAAINDHAALLEQIDSNEDGVVDEAETAQSAQSYKGSDIDSDGDGKVNSAEVADSAKTYKNNDIDSDGDGKVDAADQADNADTLDGEDASAFADANHGNEEHSTDFTTLTEVNNNADVPNADQADNATTVKGQDIDSDGDGKVDAADEADSAKTVKGNDIDSDGDGKVDLAETADYANDADASTYKGSDIDSDGDGKVDNAETADYAYDAEFAAEANEVDHSNVTNVQSDQHHEKYTDSEAADAAPVQDVHGKTGSVTLNTPLRDKNGEPKFSGSTTVVSNSTTREMTSGEILTADSETVAVSGTAFLLVEASVTTQFWDDPDATTEQRLYINGEEVATSDTANTTTSGSFVVDVTNHQAATITIGVECVGYQLDGSCDSSEFTIQENSRAADIV